jgi:drug/metabolite transporter (DMT)-like permease
MMLVQRFNAPDRHESGIFWGNLLIVLISAPWFFHSAPPTVTQWGMLLFLGFVQIGLGYMLFTYGLKRVTAVEAVLIAMLEPILNPVWVLLGYGEKPAFMALVGGGVIICMLSVQVLFSQKRSGSRLEKQL